MPGLVEAVVEAGRVAARRQPTVTADALLLRPWSRADVPVLVAGYADPAIQQWHARSMTIPEAHAWVSSRASRWAAESGADWAVTEMVTAKGTAKGTASGRVVGRTALRTIDLFEGSAEIAYWVLPAERGQRVAPRALAALADWAFTDIGLHRLVVKHSTVNAPSCAVAERAGFTLEGTARSETLHRDGWHDMHCHARLHPEH